MNEEEILAEPLVIIPLDIAGGRLAYTISRRRRRKARAIAGRSRPPVTTSRHAPSSQ